MLRIMLHLANALFVIATSNATDAITGAACFYIVASMKGRT